MQFPLEGFRERINLNKLKFRDKLKFEIDEAVRFFNGCKKYFSYVKAILNEVRNEMISRNGNFEEFLNNKEFKKASRYVIMYSKLPRIYYFVEYIDRLLPQLIEQHNEDGLAFIPADLYHLTNSVLGACTRLNNMLTLFENGSVQDISWELMQYDHEVYNIKKSIEENFFLEEYSNKFINMLA